MAFATLFLLCILYIPHTYIYILYIFYIYISIYISVYMYKSLAVTPAAAAFSENSLARPRFMYGPETAGDKGCAFHPRTCSCSCFSPSIHSVTDLSMFCCCSCLSPSLSVCLSPAMRMRNKMPRMKLINAICHALPRGLRRTPFRGQVVALANCFRLSAFRGMPCVGLPFLSR